MQIFSFPSMAGAWQKQALYRALALVIFCCSMQGAVSASAAYGHGVYITAWYEGDSVCTESYYSRKNRVIGGTVSMRGAGGAVLGEASTDGRGIACFSPRPQEQALTFQVDASPGHRATCSLSAPSASVRGIPAVPLAASAPGSSVAPDSSVVSASSAMPAPGVQVKETVILPAGAGSQAMSGATVPTAKPLPSPRDLQPAVQEVMQPAMRAIQVQLHEVQAQLRDMQDQLRSMQSRGVGFRDIVGGIGWILGLFALAGYLKRRRRARQG